ncbi:MAG: alpha/beta hydrolase fold domain-containing protein [Faecousia sp.]
MQGSGWRQQQVFQKLGTLVRFCEKGYAVAFVEYRPSDVAKFPAQMQDVKTAIRFLRKHANEFRLNTQKIALWGDSSGAHTALMVGITGDTGPDTPDYGEYSAKANCIVDWYGPVDLLKMTAFPSVADHGAPDCNEALFLGGVAAEHPDLAAAANPITYLSREKPTPPILILHGSKDHIVPFNQSVLLYEKLRELGKEVEFIKVNGGFHAFGGFHCDEARAATQAFIEKYIGKGVGTDQAIEVCSK